MCIHTLPGRQLRSSWSFDAERYALRAVLEGGNPLPDRRDGRKTN